MDEKMIEQASKMLKILADPTRFKILLTLEESEYNVTELSDKLQLEQSALSHQLKILKDGRLVKARREGRLMYYAPDDTHIYTILGQVRDHISESREQNINPDRISKKKPVTGKNGRGDSNQS